MFCRRASKWLPVADERTKLGEYPLVRPQPDDNDAPGPGEDTRVPRTGTLVKALPPESLTTTLKLAVLPASTVGGLTVTVMDAGTGDGKTYAGRGILVVPT